MVVVVVAAAAAAAAVGFGGRFPLRWTTGVASACECLDFGVDFWLMVCSIRRIRPRLFSACSRRDLANN